MPRTIDERAASLEPLARIYVALSRVNRAIEHARGEIELLQSACDIVVDVGGFRMAWAGVLDRETGEVRPVATAGHDDGYLAALHIRLDGPSGAGPTGAAIRQDRTSACRDIANDPRMVPWRSAALARGYGSSTALPLHRDGAIFGVLGVYAAVPNGFGPGETELLEELARNVSVGLDALDAAAERRRAAAALEASEERFRTSLETLLDPFVLLRPIRDPNGRIVDFMYDYANEAACVANRMPREQLVGSRLLDVLPEHGRAGLLASYAAVMETGEPLVVDDLDYVDSWGGDRMSRVFDVRASRAGDSLAYTWRDVTDRRRAERRRAEDLERRVRQRTADLETARERAFALARFSTAALDATSDQVADSLVDAVRGATGAVRGLLLVRADGSTTAGASFRIAAASPSPGDGGDLPERVAPSERVADGIDAGEPFAVGPGVDLFEPSSAAERMLADGAALPAAASEGERLVVPLRGAGERFGALVVEFGPGHEADDGEVAFVVSMANAGAHAMERLRIARAEREARGMLDAVVAQMPVGVTVVGHDGTVLYRNAADLETWRGRADPGAVDRDAQEPEARTADGIPYGPLDWPVVRSLSTGEPVVNEEIVLRRPDGTSAVVMQTSAPVRDRSGQILGAVVVTLDVTERRSAERLREAFLGVLSHELRTPVTTIFGGAKLLQTRGGRLPRAVRDEVLADVASEAERLGRLIEDLLVLARAERGVDLRVHGAALIQHRLRAVIAAMTAEWPDRRFVAEIPEHVPPVTGDESYLEQVLRNLIGNAAKYGRHEVIVRVEIDGGEVPPDGDVPPVGEVPADGEVPSGPGIRRDREVTVSVLDDGPGVDPSELERVFELFVRGRSTGRLPGAGIGLFVARQLVEAMGGRLWVANRPEGGAAFTFALPQFAEG